MSVIRRCVIGAAMLCVAAMTAQAQEEEQDSGFLDRGISQMKAGVAITVAVPDASETKELFGVPLYKKKIQPVWLDISNNREAPVTFLPLGLDPQYFTPVESAMLGSGGARKAKPKIRKFFFDQRIDIFIDPGENRSGFMFTQVQEGTKSFNVDVYTDDGELVNFTFFVPVPGLRLDHLEVDWDNLYAESEIRDLGKEELVELLEALPCCTTDKNAEGTGDPLNLVVIGSVDEVYYAFIRAGWDETEVISKSSLMKMGKSFISGSEYRYSPVSGLFVLGRPQDVAFQKARDSINERNHLRLWMLPVRFEGKPVWIGQISRDIGVRFTAKTITTHKVDPHVDETREYLVENLAYSQALSKLGYVEGVGAAALDAPRGNLTGDPYFTDGKRVVLWITSQPKDFDDIQDLDWGAQPLR